MMRLPTAQLLHQDDLDLVCRKHGREPVSLRLQVNVCLETSIFSS